MDGSRNGEWSEWDPTSSFRYRTDEGTVIYHIFTSAAIYPTTVQSKVSRFDLYSIQFLPRKKPRSHSFEKLILRIIGIIVEKDNRHLGQITSVFNRVEEIAELSARRARPSTISFVVDGSFNLVPAESLIVCKLVCNSSKCVHSTVRSDAWPFNPSPGKLRRNA